MHEIHFFFFVPSETEGGQKSHCQIATLCKRGTLRIVRTESFGKTELISFYLKIVSDYLLLHAAMMRVSLNNCIVNMEYGFFANLIQN